MIMRWRGTGSVAVGELRICVYRRRLGRTPLHVRVDSQGAESSSTWFLKDDANDPMPLSAKEVSQKMAKILLYSIDEAEDAATILAGCRMRALSDMEPDVEMFLRDDESGWSSTSVSDSASNMRAPSLLLGAVCSMRVVTGMRSDTESSEDLVAFRSPRTMATQNMINDEEMASIDDHLSQSLISVFNAAFDVETISSLILAGCDPCVLSSTQFNIESSEAPRRSTGATRALQRMNIQDGGGGEQKSNDHY